jgi:hypothetical protein
MKKSVAVSCLVMIMISTLLFASEVHAGILDDIKSIFGGGSKSKPAKAPAFTPGCTQKKKERSGVGNDMVYTFECIKSDGTKTEIKVQQTNDGLAKAKCEDQCLESQPGKTGQ